MRLDRYFYCYSQFSSSYFRWWWIELVMTVSDNAKKKQDLSQGVHRILSAESRRAQATTTVKPQSNGKDPQKPCAPNKGER